MYRALSTGPRGGWGDGEGGKGIISPLLRSEADLLPLVVDHSSVPAAGSVIVGSKGGVLRREGVLRVVRERNLVKGSILL